MGKAYDRIRAALEDAMAFAQGDTTRATIITPKDIRRRRKAAHRTRANLRIVPLRTN